MGKPIAVVTGSSSGFGLVTCLEFAKHGYRVIATMRDTRKNKLVELAREQGLARYIEVLPLDVTDEKSISAWGEYMQKMGRIDVLVNNAGYASAGFVEEIPLEEYRKQFETNVFGVIAITQIVLPMMRVAGKGKIITISSISGHVGFPGLSPYVASKHAIEGWSESLRLEMKSFGVDIILVEPGSFRTNIWSTGKTVSKKSFAHHSPYNLFMKKMENYIRIGEPKQEDPRSVASLIVKISKRSKPNFRYQIGKGVTLTIFLKKILPWRLWEKLVVNKMK